jgi:hypothetical protein
MVERMTELLRTFREALDACWRAVSAGNSGAIGRGHQTVWEVLK